MLTIFNLCNILTLHTQVNSSSLQKNSWIARGFEWEYLRSCTGYGPGRSIKKSGKSCSLHSKKFFGWGVLVFCE